MRTELRAPSLATVNKAWQWYLTGLGALLPAAIKRFGWRPREILIEQGADGGPDLRRIVEHSRLGETRLIADTGVQNLPASIALPGKKIHRTHLSLPAEAAQTLNKTVALRLDDLSPIPPEDAAFAIGETTKSTDGRINVEIAIAKKKTLSDLQEHYGGASLTTIGAHPDRNGALRFIFRTENSEERASLGPVMSVAMLLAAALFFSLAIDVHLSRRLQSLERYEASVLSALRDMRPALALFDDADPATLTQARGEPARDLIAATQNALADLPAGSRIETVRMNETGTHISGFVPTDQPGNASELDKLQRTASTPPGFNRFTYQTSNQPRPEASP